MFDKLENVEKRYEELNQKHAFFCMDRNNYINTLAELISRIPAHIVIYRLTGDGPKNLLIAPAWSADKKRVQNDIRKELIERNIIQGGTTPLCNPNPSCYTN